MKTIPEPDPSYPLTQRPSNPESINFLFPPPLHEPQSSPVALFHLETPHPLSLTGQIPRLHDGFDRPISRCVNALYRRC